jgi:FlaA1/EpsC-like NDP-sugar epimerase
LLLSSFLRRNVDVYRVATSLTPKQKSDLFVLIDAFLVIFSLFLAALLFGAKFDNSQTLKHGAYIGLFLAALCAGASLMLGLSRIRLNAFETGGVKPTAILTCILVGAGLLLNIGLDSPFVPPMFPVFGMIFLISVVATRNFMRSVLLTVYRNAKNRTRVIIYGAGQTGQQLAAALRTDNAVVLVAFVDDNPRLQSLTVSGAPVYAPSRLKDLIAKKSVDRVVLAMPSSTPRSTGPDRAAPAGNGLRGSLAAVLC